MTFRVPLVDLQAEVAALREPLLGAIGGVLASARFVLGPEVECFEAEAAAFLGAPHAVAVSSGSDALLMCLLAAGVGAGDEVLTTPFTFVASAESVLRAGALPVFADVREDSLCLDAGLAEAATTARTKAILPVHLFGSMHGIEPLAALAERRAVPIVEDAAQAFGSSRGGRSAGLWGAAAAFSFFPSKVLGALGDGGLVVTRDGAVAERCRALRQHGRTDAGYASVGGNYRLDAIQAAALRVKLRHLRGWIDQRRLHGEAYDDAFLGAPGIALVKRESDWNGAVYTLRVLDGRRDLVKRRLAEAGVEATVYYPTPLHLEPIFSHFGSKPGAFPVSERAAAEVLSLPVFPAMSDAQRDFVIDSVLAAVR